MRLRLVCLGFFLLICGWTFAQQAAKSSNNPTQVTVPHLIRFSGQANDGKEVVGITFALYKSQHDNNALWIETQNVKLGTDGKYTVLLGATKPDGIPSELFASGEAQWLGIRVNGKAEQPRVLLVSVPYALRAAEADTLAGHAASDFVTTEKVSTVVKEQLQQQTVTVAPSAASPTPVANATAAGPTNFSGATADQVVNITQSGGGMGLRATADGTAILANSLSTTGSAASISGTVASPSAAGVKGTNTATTGLAYGVNGNSASTTGTGVFGQNTATTGLNYGVRGTVFSTNGIAVLGNANATTGPTYGVKGLAASPAGSGVYGGSTATTGTGAGIIASAASPNGSAALFLNTGGGRLITGQAGAAKTEVFSVSGTGDLATKGQLSVAGGATFGGLATFAPGQIFPGTQARVTGSCPSGQYVRSIEFDGSVNCAVDFSNSGTVQSVGSTSGLTVSNPNTFPVISPDFGVLQARVSGSCPAGQMMQGIGSNGAPSCVAPVPTVPTGLSVLGEDPFPPAGYRTSGWVPFNGTSPWTPKASMAVPRHGFALGVIGTKFYAAGGYGSSGYLASLEVYDTTINTWSAIVPSSGSFTAKFGPVGASSTREGVAAFYVFGGYNGSSPVQNLDVYNPSSNTWTSKAPLPVPLFDGCAVADEAGFIYLFAGLTTTSSWSTKTYKYDPSTNTYAALADIGTGVYFPACVYSNNKIYVIGGQTTGGRTNDVQIYDIVSNTWKYGAYMPTSHFGGMAAELDGYIYVHGGMGNSGYLNVMYIYDPATDSWLSGPAGPNNRENGHAQTLNGVIYVFGGYDGGLVGSTYTYDPHLCQWVYTKLN